MKLVKEVLNRFRLGTDVKDFLSKHPNVRKSIIQRSGVTDWVNSDLKGTFEYATGVGKTFQAFECLLEYIRLGEEENTDFPTPKVLLLAEVTDRENTFREDFEKFKELTGVDLLPQIDFEFACYQSAYKWEGREFDLVIADEIHDSLTEKYYGFYERNKYEALIGLSATIDRKSVIGDPETSTITKGALLDDIAPVCARISQDEAIECGFIEAYELVVYLHKLDNKEKTVQAGTKKKPFMTTEDAAYNYADSRFKKSLYLPEKSKKFQLMHWSRKRADVLYKSMSKAKLIKKIIDEVSGRFIIFGNSLDALSAITDNVVSSKNSDEENEMIKQKFASKQINEIGSFKKIKQGENLPDVNIGILHSYYSKDKDFIQRTGRILRLNGGKYTAVVVFTTVGTKEYDWYKSMKKTSSAPMVVFDDIEELNTYLNHKINESKS